MKYVYAILLLMAGLIVAVLVIALIFIGMGTLNQDTSDTGPQTITISSRSTPGPRPTYYTTVPTPSNQDPIVGSWLNGMVFYANGTIGSEGTASWRVNENEQNSYFILSEGTSEGASSTEWVYYPGTDQINRRGSSEFISRGIPKPVPTQVSTLAATQTQPAQGKNTTNLSENGQSAPEKFSYSDCIETCKMNYWADRHVGYYNDCLNTCNIKNLG